MISLHIRPDGLSGAAHEIFEQLEFHRNELNLSAPVLHRPINQVHFQIAHPESDDAHVAASAQQGFHPCSQLANIERLDQVIVTAGLKSGDSLID